MLIHPAHVIGRNHSSGAVFKHHSRTRDPCARTQASAVIKRSALETTIPVDRLTLDNRAANFARRSVSAQRRGIIT